MANPAYLILPEIDNNQTIVEMINNQHQMIVDGVLMQEKKDLTKTLNDETGVEESHLSHVRVIGDRSYIVKQSITDGEEQEEMIETEMDDCELENFKNEWDDFILSQEEYWIQVKWIPKFTLLLSVAVLLGLGIKAVFGALISGLGHIKDFIM